MKAPADARRPRRLSLVATLLTILLLAPMALQPGGATSQQALPDPMLELSPSAMAAAGAAPCTSTDPVPAQAQRLGLVRFTDEPEAGSWATWHVDPASVPVAAPPATLSTQTAAELAEIHAAQASRTDAQVLQARSFDGPPTKLWTELFLKLIVEHSDKNGEKNPPTLSRQMALLEQAMFDALVVAWGAKYCHDRLPPSVLDPAVQPVVDIPAAPSYPSEHAAAAGAAAVLMAYFFPPGEEPEGRFDRLADDIAESRVTAGANYRSDVEAGLALGRAVGLAVIEARDDDGWRATWDGSGRLEGPCHWQPTLPEFGGPLMPMWGHVQPFLMTHGGQFRPPPPPACDGADYEAQTRDLYEMTKTLTPRQKLIADTWAAGQGTVTPPGQWLNLALNLSVEHDLGTMRHARVMAHAAAALADAAIAAWDAKFTYWSDRPILGIQRLYDPTWQPYIETPPFPGYVSGHSTFAGAVTITLAHFFPEERVELMSAATDAAMSRYYGGIHIRADNEWGLWTGEHIGTLAAMRAAADGAE